MPGIVTDEQRRSWPKSARPAGRSETPAGVRRKASTDDQPARRIAPTRRPSQNDRAVQMWSISGLRC